VTVSISVTDDRVFTALRAFLVAALPPFTEVIVLQDDGVPMPAGPFVGMNNGSNTRLSTNRTTYSDALGNKAIQAPSQYTMNVDFYGPDSGEWAATVQALFRDEFALKNFPDDIVPLYADDPMQIPLVTGEQTWAQRWRLSAVMQSNAVITVQQDFADAASVGLINVDAAYPA
jgi:hypothetical protein